MRRVNRDQAADFMRGLRGQLNGLDPNTFPTIPNDGDPDTVFNAGPPVVGSAPLNQQPSTDMSGKRAYINHNTFTQYFFTDLFFINQNYNRNFLLLQNNNPTTGPTALTMAVSFGVSNSSGAQSLNLIPGEGILFDFICPNNSVYASFIGFSGAAMAGYAIEGSYTVTPFG